MTMLLGQADRCNVTGVAEEFPRGGAVNLWTAVILPLSHSMTVSLLTSAVSGDRTHSIVKNGTHWASCLAGALHGPL